MQFILVKLAAPDRSLGAKDIHSPGTGIKDNIMTHREEDFEYGSRAWWAWMKEGDQWNDDEDEDLGDPDDWMEDDRIEEEIAREQYEHCLAHGFY